MHISIEKQIKKCKLYITKRYKNVYLAILDSFVKGGEDTYEYTRQIIRNNMFK